MLGDGAFEWLRELTETSKRSGSGLVVQQLKDGDAVIGSSLTATMIR